MHKSNKRKQSKIVTSLVDIVIPVYGRFDLLRDCIDAIPEAVKGIPYNIILVDDSSPNQDEASAFYNDVSGRSNITLIRNRENYGFAKTCNIGARRKQSPFVFFLNSDVIMHPGSIVHMVDDFYDPNIGIVGAKLLFPEGTKNGPAGKIQHVGLFSDIHGEIQHLFIGWSPDNQRVLMVRHVLAVTGAALMIRRSLFNQVGGFSEEYGRGTYEDVDLCLSVMSLNKQIVVCQYALGLHYVGSSASAYGAHFPLNRNRDIFRSRWGGSYPWTEYIHV